MNVCNILKTKNKMGKTSYQLILGEKKPIYRSPKRSHVKNLSWFINDNPDVDIEKTLNTYRLLGEDYVTQIMRMAKEEDRREILSKMISNFKSVLGEEDSFNRFFKPFHYMSKREYLNSIGFESAYNK